MQLLGRHSIQTYSNHINTLPNPSKRLQSWVIQWRFRVCKGALRHKSFSPSGNCSRFGNLWTFNYLIDSCPNANLVSSKAWLRSASSSSSWLFGCTPESPPCIWVVFVTDQYLGSKVLWHLFERREVVVVHVKFVSSWVAFVSRTSRCSRLQSTRSWRRELPFIWWRRTRRTLACRLPVHNSGSESCCQRPRSADPNRDCHADLKRDMVWCIAWFTLFWFSDQKVWEKRSGARNWESDQGVLPAANPSVSACHFQPLQAMGRVGEVICRTWQTAAKHLWHAFLLGSKCFPANTSSCCSSGCPCQCLCLANSWFVCSR